MRISRVEWDGVNARGLAAELRTLQPPLAEVGADVAAIIADVRARGDRAVLEMDARFSGVARNSPRVTESHLAKAVEVVPELADQLRLAAGEIRKVAEAEAAAESDTDTEGDAGQRVSMRSVPVGAAGTYVPGGTARYPSSALMCCIPARAAGVARIAVASPPSLGGEPDPVILAACAIAEADEVYVMGGVQAIAALALGTETVQPVDVIAGPGNRYVQEAKRQLFGQVGIDGIAGPTELMVILGEGSNADWAALDVCAQAEHGPDGLMVVAATDTAVLDRVEAEVSRIAGADETTVADAPLALVAIPEPRRGIELADALAPEHLELSFEGAESLAAEVTTAGCVFVGPDSGAAFGDFAAGSNHVLPTGGAGRFTGPLGPGAFRRRIATVTMPPGSARKLAPTVATLARAEGFPQHGESATARSGEGETRGRSEPHG